MRFVDKVDGPLLEQGCLVTTTTINMFMGGGVCTCKYYDVDKTALPTFTTFGHATRELFKLKSNQINSLSNQITLQAHKRQ